MLRLPQRARSAVFGLKQPLVSQSDQLGLPVPESALTGGYLHSAYFWLSVFGMGARDALGNLCGGKRHAMHNKALGTLGRAEELRQLVSAEHLAYNERFSRAMVRLANTGARLLSKLQERRPSRLLDGARELSELQRQQRWFREGVVKRVTLSDAELLRMDHLMQLCAASYGYKTLHFLGLGQPEMSCNRSGIRLLAGLRDEDILIMEDRSQLFRPGYFVCVDHDTRRVVAVVRGTMRVQDVVTDVICDEVPLVIRESGEGPGAAGTVHEGFLRAAQTLALEMHEPVQDALRRFPDYQLAVAGHSLGGACASLLALIWAQVPLFAARQVRAYAFAAPCSMSYNLARSDFVRRHVTSIALGDDFITRLSFASVEGLLQACAALAAAQQLPRHDKCALLDKLRRENRQRKDRMYPGGVVYHLPLRSRYTNMVRNEVHQAEEIDPALSLCEILLTPKMLSVHLPNRYLNAIRMQRKAKCHQVCHQAAQESKLRSLCVVAGCSSVRPCMLSSTLVRRSAKQRDRVAQKMGDDMVEGDEVMEQLRRKLGVARVLMRVLKSVAPLSLGALLYKLVQYLTGNHKHWLRHPTSRLLTLLNVTALAEAVFAIVCAFVKLRGQQPLDEAVESTREERQATFSRCLDTVDEPRDFATRWMRDVPLHKLRRGNVEDWLSWGLFGKDAMHLAPAEQSEMLEYVSAFEARCNYRLREGHNGTVRCYKFDHEPVESEHRPLAYYGIVHGLLQRVIAPLSLSSLGFGRRVSGRSLNYWIRRSPEPPRRAPLVLIHGIGIGVLPYVPFVRTMVQAMEADGARDLVVLELPAVAQQLFPGQLLPDNFVADVLWLFEREMLDPGCFVGHSYGTFCLSWLVKQAPEVVESLAFLDPAPFLLHHSMTLRAIVYQEAYTLEEKLFQYFLRSELFFNNHIRRHFLWQKNLLFFDDIPDRVPTLLVLSEEDDIMPVKEILQMHKASSDVDHIEVLFLDNHVHGGLLFSNKSEVVVRKVLSL